MMATKGEVPVAYGLVFSVQVIFTTYQILAHVALAGRGLDPVAFVLLRAVGTAALLLAIAGLTVGPKEGPLVPTRQHLPRFILLGFFMVCNTLGLVFALKNTTSALVAILQVLRPIFAGLISRALGIERFSVPQMFGIAICLLGTGLVTLNNAQETSTGSSPLLGFAFVCVHSLGQSSYVIMQPTLLDAGYSPVVINAVSFAIASCMTAMMMPFRSGNEGIWFENTAFFWSVTLFSVVFVGAYSYAAMGWAAKRIGGTAVMLFMLLQAMLTVIAGYIFLGEALRASQLVGGMFLLVGIAFYVLAGRTDVHGSSQDESKPVIKV